MSMLGAVGYNAGGQITLNMPGLETFETDITNIQNTVTQVGDNTTAITDLQTFTGYDENYSGDSLLTLVTGASDNTNDIVNIKLFIGWPYPISKGSIDDRLAATESTSSSNETDITSLQARVSAVENSVSVVPDLGTTQYFTAHDNGTTQYFYPAWKSGTTKIMVNNHSSNNDTLTRLRISAAEVVTTNPSNPIETSNVPFQPQWELNDVLEISLLRVKNNSNHNVEIEFDNHSGATMHYTKTKHSGITFVCNHEANRGYSTASNWDIIDTGDTDFGTHTLVLSNKTYFRYRVWQYQIPEELVTKMMSKYNKPREFFETTQGNVRTGTYLLLEAKH